MTNPAVIASEARQSRQSGSMDCHVAALLAMTVMWLSLRAKRGNPCLHVSKKLKP